MIQDNILALRTQNMKASAIRELLKLAAKPGMISLGGGYPAAESFPMPLMAELTASVLEKYGTNAMQYGPTEGFTPLREALVPHLKSKHFDVAVDDILITSGSQGFLDAIGKILINPGDVVAVEAPTYLGAIQAFNAYGPKYVRMLTDEDGVIPESMEEVLENHPVKFIYLVPTFQNPTGRTIPLARRKKIVEIIQRHNALVIEDDPYSEIRYRGEAVPPLKQLAPDHVVYASTLSKVFAPGFRIGYCLAPQLIHKWLVLAKQGVDLHTSTYTQALASEYIAGGHLNRQMPKTVEIYKAKQQVMLDAMDAHFPKTLKWAKPDGGMFIWVEGPQGVDMEEIYVKSVEKNVAFVPGKAFYTNAGEGLETMRLNYTSTDGDGIRKAVQILGGVIQETLG